MIEKPAVLQILYNYQHCYIMKKMLNENIGWVVEYWPGRRARPLGWSPGTPPSRTPAHSRSTSGRSTPGSTATNTFLSQQHCTLLNTALSSPTELFLQLTLPS